MGVYECVWDEFSEYVLENRVPTSADFNTYPIQIFGFIIGFGQKEKKLFRPVSVLAETKKSLLVVHYQKPNFGIFSTSTSCDDAVTRKIKSTFMNFCQRINIHLKIYPLNSSIKIKWFNLLPIFRPSEMTYY